MRAPPGVAQTREVHGIHLFAALLGDVPMRVEQVVLVGKLLTGEDHRHAHRGEQAGEGELDALLGVGDAVAVEEVEEALVAKTLARRAR